MMLRIPNMPGLAILKKLLLEWVTLEKPRCWKRNSTPSPHSRTRKSKMYRKL
jgi:hypothetical protein